MTWADGDNSTCLGGKRWDEYRGGTLRTYSSMSWELSSAVRITHVLKHNDGSENGSTTKMSGSKRTVSEPFRFEANLGRLRFSQLGSILAPIKEDKIRQGSDIKPCIIN